MGTLNFVSSEKRDINELDIDFVRSVGRFVSLMLERDALERVARLERESYLSLLANVLPVAVATRLRQSYMLERRGSIDKVDLGNSDPIEQKEGVGDQMIPSIATRHKAAVIVFIDIVNFTEEAERLAPMTLLSGLNTFYSALVRKKQKANKRQIFHHFLKTMHTYRMICWMDL